MDEAKGSVIVEFTPEFKRNLRALARKYRNIRADVQPVIETIQKGEFVGDQVPRTGDFTIYKVRVKNRDIHKGKSAGYRLIYYAQTDKKVILITIYSKTEQADITPGQIRQILKKFADSDEDSAKDADGNENKVDT